MKEKFLNFFFMFWSSFPLILEKELKKRQKIDQRVLKISVENLDPCASTFGLPLPNEDVSAI